MRRAAFHCAGRRLFACEPVCIRRRCCSCACAVQLRCVQLRCVQLRSAMLLFLLTDSRVVAYCDGEEVDWLRSQLAAACRLLLLLLLLRLLHLGRILLLHRLKLSCRRAKLTEQNERGEQNKSV